MLFQSNSGVFFGGNAVSFDGRKNATWLRVTAAITCLFTAWLLFPRTVFAKPRVYKAYSQLTEKGLTQTPDAKLRAKIDARENAERQKAAAKPRADVEPLSAAEMLQIRGRGDKRNKYFAGSPMPWHRSLRDVNLCNGNLFKSFTDVQVAPGRGAGLVLQRTYNSNDDRAGAFGIGWTHAYDIRIEEAGAVVENNVEKELVPRTDFFGGKHKYTRDADGLYTPPAYLYDEMDSRYDEEMVSGLPRSEEDTQVGMDGTVKHFVPEGTDAAGRPSPVRVCDYIEDRYGNRTTLTYGQTITFTDGSTKKLLTQVKDPVNRTLVFAWQNFGTSAAPAFRIISVQSPLYMVTYEYYQNAGDASSYLNLWRVRVDSTGLNRVTTYTYTTVAGETGLLASIADPLGNAVSYTYTITPGTRTRTVWGDLVAPPGYNPTGTVWANSITEPGGIVAGTGQARSQVWTIDTGGTWYANSYGLGIINFKSSGGIQGYLGIDGSLRANVMNDGQLFDVSQNLSFAWNYDITNNVTRAFEYNTPGNYNVARTRSTEATYGPHGNVLTQFTSGFPGQTTYTYYNASKYFQKASVTDALGRTSTFDYFDNKDILPGNRGNMAWVRDAGYGVSGSPSFGKQFTYTYNQYGQKASETNLNGVVTNYTYGDAWGNLTQVVQDPGTGRLNRTTAMVYDTVGKVTSSTDPNGQASTFLYNKLGQPTSATFPAKAGVAAGETISYQYGLNGRTESVTDGRGTTSMSYENGCDWVSSVTDPVTGTTGYTYRLGGERDTMLLPGGGVVSYQYATTDVISYGQMVHASSEPDKYGHKLVGITDDQGRQVSVTLDDFGRSQWVRFNQVYNSSAQLVGYAETKHSYGPTNSHLGRGWLTQSRTVYRVTATGADRLLYQNDYTYNNLGQRTANTITTTNAQNQLVSRTESYTYDEQSRLKTANYGDGQNQTYGFDAMGNRTAKTDNVTGSESYAFDNANRIATRQVGSSGVTTYTSDANGNTLTDASHTNQWDSQNQLVSSLSNGKTSAFKYGADGLRRRFAVTPTGQSQATTITHYGYDGSNVVREWEENIAGVLNVSATYLLGASGPAYKCPANATDVRWYVYDGLGSVVGEVDVSGNVTSAKKHDVFGLRRGTVGTEKSRHGFVGGLGHYSDDETGLVYMRARYYDPAVGRFISEDKRGDGNNWFAYCNNDPVNKADANGNVSNSLVTIFTEMMAACGINIDGYQQRLLLDASAALFGALLFTKYTLELMFKRIDWQERANQAMEGRIAGEALGLTEEAGLCAIAEKNCRGRAAVCLITQGMLPILFFIASSEENIMGL